MGSRSRSNILQPRTDAAAAREARSATAPRGRSGKAPWLLLVLGETRRREPAVVYQQPPVVPSAQFGDRWRSRAFSRRGYRNRGIGIAGTTTPLWWKRSCQGTA